jgi:hypothetical protein
MNALERKRMSMWLHFGLLAVLFVGAGFGLRAQNDSLPPGLEIFSNVALSSSAMPPWALMGAVFGGDITAPLAIAVARTDVAGQGFFGGQAEAGILLRWVDKADNEVRVGLTSRAWSDVRWSPGAAHLFWGPLGGADPENQPRDLAKTRFRGLATSAFTVSVSSEHIAFTGRLGEAHWGADLAVEDAPFFMDTAQIDFRLVGQFNRSLATGLMAGIDLEFRQTTTIGQADVNWAVGIRDLGGFMFPLSVETTVDSSIHSTGWPLITGLFDTSDENPNYGLHSDTIGLAPGDDPLKGVLPATYYIRARAQGWSAYVQKNSWAPRPEFCAIKTFAHSSEQRSVHWQAGLGWGGWGGLYVPLGVNLTGHQGRTFSLRTRVAPGPDLGLRTTLMCAWGKKF